MNNCMDSLRKFLPFSRREEQLPDLDLAYDTEFNAWYEKYERALGVLLRYAVEELPPEDYRFLQEHPAVLLQATTTATRVTRHIAPTFRGNPSVTQDTTLPGNSSLLFMAQHDGRCRYYLISLGRGNENAAIMRHIEPAGGKIGAYIENHPDTFFDPKALAEVSDGAILTSTGVRELDTCEAGMPADCIKNMAGQVALLSRERIREYGYGQTRHQRTVAEIQDFLLSVFVPGYDCASNIHDGNYEEAVVPCVFDFHGIVMPLMSRFTRAGLELGKVAAKSLPFVASREIREILARQGGWVAAGAIASRMQPHLANAGKRFASGLGKDLLRIADPGFELMHDAARVSTSLAEYMFGDVNVSRKLYKTLRKDPHTQHAAKAAKARRRQAGKALQPRYEGKLSSDIHGEFCRFKLPPGVKVLARPALGYVAPYNTLGGGIDFYEIDGIIYAHNTNPENGLHVLERADGLVRHCIAKRAIGNAACVTVEMLPRRNDALAPKETGYRFDVGRGQTRVYQADPVTRRKTYLVPTIEAYPVPRMIAGEKHWIVPMLDEAYELKLTRKNELFAEIIDVDFNKLALEAPDAEYPTEGKIVPGSAREGLELVQFTLKNGINECTFRAPYGSFTGSHRVFFGMIVLHKKHILVDLRESAESGVVTLSRANEAEINSYRRFQNENLAAEDLRTSKTFSMELSHAGAGSVLRLYRNYNLAPYKALLETMASKPGQDRLRIAEAIDAYIKDPEAADQVPAFRQIKSRFDEILRNQFGSIENVRNFERHLTEAVTQNNERLNIQWIDPASQAMEETLDTIAMLFPDTADACSAYKESLKVNTADAAEHKRISFSKFRYKFFGKNIAAAQLFRTENNVPTLKNIVFAISGKQQTIKKNAHMKIRTIESDEMYINADLAIAHMKESEAPPGQGNRHGEEPSLHYPDINKNTGARLWRGDDAEAKVLRVLRGMLKNPDEAADFKIISTLPPCVLCTQAIAMFLEDYPNVKIELLFIRHDREGLHTSPRARRQRRGISRARLTRRGWPLYLGGTFQRDRPAPPSLRA